MALSEPTAFGRSISQTLNANGWDVYNMSSPAMSWNPFSSWVTFEFDYKPDCGEDINWACANMAAILSNGGLLTDVELSPNQGYADCTGDQTGGGDQIYNAGNLGTVVVHTGSPATGTPRTVIARVTGGVQFFSNLGLADVANNIKAALINAGWNIRSVNAETTLLYPTGQQTFTITAVVDPEYSDSDVVAHLISDLGGLLTGIGVSIVSTTPNHTATPGANPPGSNAASGSPFAFLETWAKGNMTAAILVGLVGVVLLTRNK